ncbi:MAG: hypothetical protein C0515_00875 [Novosphingobium sp.]|nr:hypothetical protein [Novosphingobium sp.]MBX9644202.1 hypothetical protein [Novosphingobium sp.]
MKLRIAPLLLALAAPALAVPGGPIGQIPPGNFLCEMPGDATGAVGLRVPDEDFVVVNANTYRTAKGRGTYLLTGDLLVLTSGPKNGDKYRLISNNFLRKLGADGQEGSLRCVRRVVNNS